MVWVGDQSHVDVYNTEKLGSDTEDEESEMWRPGTVYYKPCLFQSSLKHLQSYLFYI